MLTQLKLMIPKIIMEVPSSSTLFMENYAWYDVETNTIHVVEGVKPRWLAILHEYGHWLIGYAPDWLHRRVSLDYEYDTLWEKLGLSNSLDITEIINTISTTPDPDLEAVE